MRLVYMLLRDILWETPYFLLRRRLFNLKRGMCVCEVEGGGGELVLEEKKQEWETGNCRYGNDCILALKWDVL